MYYIYYIIVYFNFGHDVTKCLFTSHCINCTPGNVNVTRIAVFYASLAILKNIIIFLVSCFMLHNLLKYMLKFIMML